MRAVVFGLSMAAVVVAHAAPLTPADVTALCANAEDTAHCGRLIEERQLKTLPGLAARNGDELRVSLYPSGSVVFRDVVRISGAQTYALWDVQSAIDGVVLFTTDGDRSGYLLLTRSNGKQYRLPAEPVVAPDRRYLATADFCADDCTNELALWRVTRDDVRKERVLVPERPWNEAVVEWRGPDRLQIEYRRRGEQDAARMELALDDPLWRPARDAARPAGR
jgi:hypothetical protein